MQGFVNKTAIVTGGGQGIGRAIARRLADEGAVVAVNDIDASNAAETVDLIENEGGTAMTAVADVTDYTEVQAMVGDVIAAQDGVDIHVNNAGWDRIEWFVDQEPDIWDRIIDINLKGQLNCAHVVAQHFIEAETSGKIVNIASDAARVGSSGEAVYSGTKGGVVSFTKTLARELARYDVNCNAVAPGPTETPLVEEIQESDLGEKILGGIKNQVPFGRMAHPEDIAGGVAFLVSADADFITGQILSVSGGLTMVG